ncbi:MAG: SH3 domain-containing protein [Sandaracinobacteroides sp.]
MHRAIAFLLLLAAPAAAQDLPVPASGLAIAQAGASDGKAEAGQLPTNKDALKYRSGLPTPRFVSLRSGRAYMRAGPGKTYPVTWVYVRPGLPLEVLSEWNVWRKVRDAEGTEGWMDRAMLSSDRAIQITRQTRDLRARPDLSSPIVLRAEPGVVMRVTMCADRWCRVEGQGRSGYLLREHGFGVYPTEPIG